MPIDDDMTAMLREVNELTQAYRSEIADLGGIASEISNLGSFAPEFGTAALGCATGVATSIAVPTSDNEVNYRPAVQQWAVCTP